MLVVARRRRGGRVRGDGACCVIGSCRVCWKSFPRCWFTVAMQEEGEASRGGRNLAGDLVAREIDGDGSVRNIQREGDEISLSRSRRDDDDKIYRKRRDLGKRKRLRESGTWVIDIEDLDDGVFDAVLEAEEEIGVAAEKTCGFGRHNKIEGQPDRVVGEDSPPTSGVGRRIPPRIETPTRWEDCRESASEGADLGHGEFHLLLEEGSNRGGDGEDSGLVLRVLWAGRRILWSVVALGGTWVYGWVGALAVATNFIVAVRAGDFSSPTRNL
ncbi:imidazole glycerol phosphate synthase subunit HisF [Striga asiatica]|uniref:Imidazole glycerol phosphate synthase subunit HisF n=1 Tax=Striga asiatica TaxID=4170 RepID=A0A5A7PUI0_STRAF|nr:imidazole glycerol phosphate synthase subunit HisF [Striga asiatica]